MFYSAANNFIGDKIIMVEMEVWGSCKNNLLVFIFKTYLYFNTIFV